MATFSRRNFLGSSAAVAAGALTAGSTALTTSPAAAVEPIDRAATSPRLRFSMAAYSYKSLLSGPKPKLTMEDFITDCAKLGLDGTELTGYWFAKDFGVEYLHKLKHLAYRLGLSISGTACATNFCVAKPEPQIAHAKLWVDHAAAMGAPALRVFIGAPPAGVTEKEAFPRAVAAFEEVCEHAAKRGVFVGVENHHGLTTTADQTLELMKAVKNPWFGLWLDGGNYHTDDVYGDLAKVAQYAIYFHVKVMIQDANRKKQPADFKRFAKILKDAGYRGWVSLEYEENEDPREVCPRFLDQMRKEMA